MLWSEQMFPGLSKAGIVSGKMVAKMAARPLIFALANPTPEIMPEEVAAGLRDAIMATGDLTIQSNQQRLRIPLHFPGRIGRPSGKITEGMKMAAQWRLLNWRRCRSR
ncbi:MAG: hypothetical protein Ct9H90mP16_11630 [Candidatus Poseidoniales archaeon]|nr:MAG: hypothetical protein Ct9H90mP16_11630 [Candidatus Poseidoniales archaeon]